MLTRGKADLPPPFFVSLLLAVFLASSLARAQIMLPGALEAQPGGPNGSLGSAGSASKLPRLAGLKAPALQSILGRDLAQNGSNGTISLRSAGDGAIEIVKLTLAGESMSRPGEPCAVDVTAAELVKARLDGRPNGLLRYAVEFPASLSLSMFWTGPSSFPALRSCASSNKCDAGPIRPASGAREATQSARIRQNKLSMNAAGRKPICGSISGLCFQPPPRIKKRKGKSSRSRQAFRPAAK
jgi:hypothetical protein